MTTLNTDAQKFIEQDPIPAYVNGEWISQANDTHTVMDPSTGNPISSVTMFAHEQVDAAAQAAHKAFAAWSNTSVEERAVLLHRLADRIEAETETLAQLESLDVGKPIQNARAFDIPFGADCLRYFADMSVSARYSTPLALKNMEARVHRSPYGACGFIFPWNFPFTLLCWGLGPCLASGNTAVVKASEVTPLSSLYFAKLAEAVGIPAGVINIFTGFGPDAGQPLAEHPLIKRMSFTGSSAVGKIIGRICGERVAPCKLELGGKGAAIVLDDCDLETAAEGLANAITLNTGQVCCTATRWFIHEKFTTISSTKHALLSRPHKSALA